MIGVSNLGQRNDGYSTLAPAVSRGQSESENRSHSCSQCRCQCQWFRGLRFWSICFTCFLIVLVLLFIITFVADNDNDKNTNSDDDISLEKHLSLDNVMSHLTNFQNIAMANGGNRHIAGLGFNGTLEYLVSSLASTNFVVNTQEFTVAVSTLQNTPTLQFSSFSLVYGTDFRALQYSGGGSLSSTPSFLARNFGCQLTDYAISSTDSADGKVVVVERGNCTFQQKTDLAIQCGAAALIIYNQVNSGFSGTLSGPASIPVFGVSLWVGSVLSSLLSPISLSITPLVVSSRVANLVASSPYGDPNNVILVGAHYDSVQAGPGINDDGSGTATILELALLSDRLWSRFPSRIVNQVRFAWWAAEEEGLLGSRYYAKMLTNTTKNNDKTQPTWTRQEHACNLNFDMLGSPNFVYGINGVQFANLSTYSPATIHGSNVIGALFADEFKKRKKPFKISEMNGRSDYAPFMDLDIAASGLDTGAEVQKSVSERAIWGGLSNTAFDPCYHQSCDTVDNISREALQTTSSIAAAVIGKLATMSMLRAKLSS